ncbi:MAG: hypothetical protein IKH54_01725 [Bacilli bacterium]|nr:hypothetical protein [Bacilli bacterium]
MSVYTYVNLATACCCLIFSILLLIIYFSKKNMDNIENGIYKNLLFLVVVCIIVSITFDIAIFNYDIGELILLYRFYYISLILWVFCLLVYVFVITSENREAFYKKIITNKSRYTVGFYLCLIIFSIIELFLPLYKISTGENSMGMILGLGVYFFYGCMILFLLLGVIIVAINFKSTNKKKLIPFYIISVLGVVSLVFAAVIPELSVIQIWITMVSYIMYFTIENPDMKMVTELEFAKTQAEQANNAKSDFLSSMSHELRTPLNAIVGLSEMIISSEDISEVHEDGKDILKASNNLLELVDGILDFNMIESNNLELVDVKYNTSEFFNSLTDLIKDDINSKNLEFRYRLSDNLPEFLVGDKAKIKTIIYNLLSNSVKYTNEGFVELNIDCTIKDDNCILRISVSDSGNGIKDEDLSFIFDKFYRSSDNKDSSINGSGLGLAITKSLVELMDGKITVNSNEGIGTTFYVTIAQGLSDN